MVPGASLGGLVLALTWRDTITLGNVISACAVVAALVLGARVTTGPIYKQLAEALEKKLELRDADLAAKGAELDHMKQRMDELSNLVDAQALVRGLHGAVELSAKVVETQNAHEARAQERHTKLLEALERLGQRAPKRVGDPPGTQYTP